MCRCNMGVITYVFIDTIYTIKIIFWSQGLTTIFMGKLLKDMYFVIKYILSFKITLNTYN